MARFIRNETTLFSEVGDDIVALDVARGECFGMNEVAANVWRMLEKPMSVEEICAALRDQYDVDASTCRRDIAELLDMLLARTLVRPVPSI